MITKEVFEDVSMIQATVFLCDAEGNELEFEDYKEKGVTLKVKTEEVTQEITRVGRRYPNNPELYWEQNKDTVRNRENALYRRFRREYTFVDAPQSSIEGTDDLPTDFDTVLNPKSLENQVNWKFNKKSGIRIKSTNPSQKVPRFTEVIGKGFKKNLVARYHFIENTYAYVGTPSVMTYTPVPNGAEFEIMEFVDCALVNDKFTDDPDTQKSFPENTQKLEALETHSERTPTRYYRAENLDDCIKSLLKDNVWNKYKITKLMIGRHTDTILTKFKGPYNILPDTYSKVFKRFKSLEIDNNLITVSFPKGPIEFENLILKYCGVIANDTSVKVTGNLEITDIRVINKSGKSAFFNVESKGDMTIGGIDILNPATFTFTTTDPEKAFSITKCKVKFTDTVSTKMTSLIKVIGFKKADIVDHDSLEVVSKNLVMYNISGCGETAITGMKLAGEHKYSRVIIDGGTKLDFMDVEDSAPLGTLFTLKNMKSEPVITCDNVKVKCGRLFSFNSCNISEVTMNDCEVTCDSMYSFMKTEMVPKMTANKCKFMFNGDFKSQIIETTFDNTEIHCKNLRLTVMTKLSLSTGLLKCADRVDLTLGKDGSSINVKSFPLYGKEINVTSKFAKTKLELIESLSESKRFNMDGITDVNFQFSSIDNNVMSMENLEKFAFKEVIFRAVKVFDMKNIKELNIQDSTTESSGEIRIHTDNVFGSMMLTVKEGSKRFSRGTTNSGTLEKYYGDFKLTINSTDCNSSAFVVDDVSKLKVTPMCKDFKLFKKIIPLEFKEGSSGKRIYDEIYYGVM